LERILAWFAMAIAAAIVVVAVIELDSRTDGGLPAIPTLGPTAAPSNATGPTLAPPTTRPLAPRASVAATSSATPAPSFSRTPKPIPTPERTVPPPRTPTPSPASTLRVQPIDKSQGPTPHTGGGAVPNGLLIAVLALVLRAAVRAPRRRAR
jgi:hypothetical protein